MNARVKEGIVDYAGHQGSVRLSAGWEINLKFTSHEFIGGLDAVSEGPTRVLIPEGFATWENGDGKMGTGAHLGKWGQAHI